MLKFSASISRATTCFHAPTRAKTRSADVINYATSALVMSSSHIINACVSNTSTLNQRLRHQANIINVDFFWVDFLLSKCSLPSFSHRFHFCSSIFADFATKWRIRTGLLLFAIIVADNPANVFAIFVNVLTTILRLAIIAID